MKQRLDPERKLAISLLLFTSLLATGCSKGNEEEVDKIEITPIPTQAAGASPTPPANTNMPLNPMETWCESMMVKPDQEWSQDDAKKFSRQCLYSE